MNEPLTLLGLRAENYRRLVAVDIRPESNVVEIRGANGEGKTSILEAIWTALRSADLKLEKPLRDGTQHGYIELDMGRLKVTRTFTEKNPLGYLKVESGDGFKASSPQTVVDKLFNVIAFDPLRFADMTPAQQAAELRRVAPLEVDVDALDKRRKELFDERTIVNRDAKNYASAAAQITFPADTPETDVDEAALTDKLAKAGEENTEREREIARRREMEDRIKRGVEAWERTLDAAKAKRARIEELRREIEALELTAADLDKQATDLWNSGQDLQAEFNALPPLPEPVDVSDLQAQIAAARATNHNVGLRRRKAELADKAAKLDEVSDGLTAEIAKIDAQKAAAIAKAKMPVEGLGFADGSVTFNGQPFSQASKAEQIRVGMAIAVAANPTLRVVTIKDASLLDAKSRAMVEEMAAKHGLQVWLELVDTSAGTGFVIEDGRVVGSDFEGTIKEPEPDQGDTADNSATQADNSAPLTTEAAGEPAKVNPLMFPTDLNRVGKSAAQLAAEKARARAAVLPGLGLEK